ncbi:hypothetical protein [Amycolatopsis sp. NPDC051903]|uniref:phage shock envelope stress response protein PspM n=1 Tax=Amycolatopsis sp. NPDC051903 TaxID=3363936 RepID=UPI0037B1A9D2
MAGGNGRRDFNEFNAKLEKHIEKLPEYAQKAQEKLHRYFPPPAGEAGGGKPAAQQRPAYQRPPALRRPTVPTTFSQVAGQVPAVAEVRAKWQRWNEPAARHQRRINRTSRALTLWLLITILLGVLTVLSGTGLLGNGQPEVFQTVLSGFGTIVFGTFSARTGLKLRELKKLELPAAATAPPPPLPPAGSAAREPMERLAESEASLGELLRQLSVPTSLGTTAVPEISVADARTTAREAAAALRGLAARIQAIERGRNSAPARERAALDAAIAKMREQLDDGIEAYGSLVAAAGRAVAASSDGMGTSKQALTEATDHLAGLALALRELS